MADEIVDLNEVLERVQQDTELLLELFEIFLDDCPKKVNALRIALGEKNVEQIKEIAHSMKGASSNIAAKKINAIFKTIEQMAKENKLDDLECEIEKIGGQLEELKMYCQELKEKYKAT